MLKSLYFSYEPQTYYAGCGPGKTEVENQKVLGPSMIIRRQTATFWHYDQLIRAMRMEDSQGGQSHGQHDGGH